MPFKEQYLIKRFGLFRDITPTLVPIETGLILHLLNLRFLYTLDIVSVESAIISLFNIQISILEYH